MHNLVIYGASGMGREVAEIVRQINAQHRFWNVLGFIDDGEVKDCLGEYKHLGGMDFIKNFDKPLDVVLAIANPKVKRKLYDELKPLLHVHFPHVIAPTAILYSRVDLGEGAIIAHNCVVSVDSKLGRCVFLNTGTNVGHDATLGDFCSVMAHVDICGHVTVGSGTLIGTDVSVLPGLKIGENSTVGMGAVVLTPVANNCTVLGNPARKW